MKPIDQIQEEEAREKAGAKMIKKHKKVLAKLKAYPVGDGKTVFYCDNDKRGKQAVDAYREKNRVFVV